MWKSARGAAEGAGTESLQVLPSGTSDATGAAARSGPLPAPRLRHRLEALGFRAVFSLFGALPRERALRLGARIGEFFYLVDRGRRRVAYINLQLAFPDKSVAEHERILRASCRNLGRVAAEFCQLPRLEAGSVDEMVEIADRASWEHAQERARVAGGIVVTAHLGNWELLAYVQGLLGNPVHLVHRRFKNPLVENIVTRLRATAGTTSIAKKAAAREALAVLRRKQILAIPADQNQTARDGVFVDFFGRPASTTSGVARLAMRTGACIFPVFLIRVGESGRHRLEIMPEIHVANTGDREEDIRETMQRCSRAIEEMIRRYPEQWIWFHKRWRTRPQGMSRLY